MPPKSHSLLLFCAWLGFGRLGPELQALASELEIAIKTRMHLVYSWQLHDPTTRAGACFATLGEVLASSYYKAGVARLSGPQPAL